MSYPDLSPNNRFLSVGEKKVELVFLPVDTIRLSFSQSMVAGGEALTTHLKCIRETSKKLAQFIIKNKLLY